MKDQQKLIAKYGLFTAISMVIGQVIGSGIFFKVDDVLLATEGNTYAGFLGFMIVGISVIFAASSMANYAELLPKDGGILGYVGFRFGKKAATLVGWMYLSLFFPILTSVLFTVSGIYISHFIQEFWDFQPTFLHYSAIGFFNLSLFLILNIYKPKTSGIFQQITTILKLIPLILIAAFGIVLMLKGGNPDVPTFSQQANVATSGSPMWLLVAASFIPIAFAFDGWYIATQISGEIRNSKKNLPIAMVLGTLVIMSVYVLYYCGIVYGMDSHKILELKDGYITEFSRNRLGNFGALLIQIFIIISVLGTANGLLLASTRVPYQFYNLERSKKFLNLGKLHPKTNTPVNSALLAFSIISIYIYLFYFTNTNSFFTNIGFDLSAVPIAFMYIVNGALFLGLIKLIKNGTLGSKTTRKYLMVFGAILGVSIVLIGTAITPNGMSYIGISVVFFLAGLLVVRS